MSRRALAGAVAAAGGLVAGLVAAPSQPRPAPPSPGGPRALASHAVHGGVRSKGPERMPSGYVPSDPLAPSQWYIATNRSFDAWDVLPLLAPVRVAVIDSGIDLGHPELAGRVAAARSFVGGTANDVRGHGTIVAGVIAAEIDNGVGIAGLAPSAELLVGKVVGPGGTISVEAEAKAIRWAVDRGARIVNMSLGGLRDPRNPGKDTYSTLEAEAVAYAVSKGALVVAPVGNGDQSPTQPWPYASYPAALPHVLGVSASDRGGGAPAFSNRDAVYNDLSAPGEDVVSTFPRVLTAAVADCVDRGYTPCAPAEFSSPEGTSFAAPQVTAAAANLLAIRPDLRAEQVAALLERTARDAASSTGCTTCPPGRDAFSGWGRLDAAAAIAALDRPLPARDALEANDDAGPAAYRLYFATGKHARTLRATLDFWDDVDDVYSVYLRRGERLYTSLTASGAAVTLALWQPGTGSVESLAEQGHRLRVSGGPGARERLSWTAREAGWHFLQAHLIARVGPVPYRLSIVRAPKPPSS